MAPSRAVLAVSSRNRDENLILVQTLEFNLLRRDDTQRTVLRFAGGSGFFRFL